MWWIPEQHLAHCSASESQTQPHPTDTPFAVSQTGDGSAFAPASLRILSEGRWRTAVPSNAPFSFTFRRLSLNLFLLSSYNAFLLPWESRVFTHIVPRELCSSNEHSVYSHMSTAGMLEHSARGRPGNGSWGNFFYSSVHASHCCTQQSGWYQGGRTDYSLWSVAVVPSFRKTGVQG